MNINISHRLLKAGNIVEVKWECTDADSPRLVLHNDKRETTLAVPPEGVKKFRLKGTSGMTWIGLRAYVNGQDKLIKRRLLVWGKAPKGDKFEYVDSNSGRPNRFKAAITRWWNMFTPEKKRLYVILLLLLAYQLVMAFSPIAAHWFLTGIIFWLFWNIIKR